MLEIRLAEPGPRARTGFKQVGVNRDRRRSQAALHHHRFAESTNAGPNIFRMIFLQQGLRQPIWNDTLAKNRGWGWVPSIKTLALRRERHAFRVSSLSRGSEKGQELRGVHKVISGTAQRQQSRPGISRVESADVGTCGNKFPGMNRSPSLRLKVALESAVAPKSREQFLQPSDGVVERQKDVRITSLLALKKT